MKQLVKQLHPRKSVPWKLIFEDDEDDERKVVVARLPCSLVGRRTTQGYLRPLR